MPVINIEREAGNITAGELFSKIVDFESYPRIAESVLEVAILDRDGDTCTTRWDVAFRGGVLRWTESDVIDTENLAFTFEQIEGDLEMFRGSWTVHDVPEGGARIVFEAKFDLGMPSLAPMLDPIALQELQANVIEMIDTFVSSTKAGEALGSS
ncbi:type II toxin-antitoxin system RatA family toxin [Rhodococcus sp. NPDC058514]|uniref:type II toxin-antitoxin system RatA family toxin n=1 Tax=unclassified Rhodococcus (in: high G+C Gram-positive bacteria) TaxID=192944 RepID=UPI0036552469